MRLSRAITRREEIQVYEDGRQAYFNGLNVDSCPYELSADGVRRAWWIAGLYDAEIANKK